MDYGWTVNLVPTGTFLIQMSWDNRTVSKVVYHCCNCPNKYMWAALPSGGLELSILNLNHLNIHATHMKKYYSERPNIASIGPETMNLGSCIKYPRSTVKACEFLYRNRMETSPTQIGCEPRHILVENLAAELNATVEFNMPLRNFSSSEGTQNTLR